MNADFSWTQSPSYEWGKILVANETDELSVCVVTPASTGGDVRTFPRT